MSEGKHVLFVGLDPAVVDYEKWPGLTAEKLMAALEADGQTLNELGYETSLCFVDQGETAAEVLEDALLSDDYDCIMVGAGVRTDSDLHLLFERLVNVIHQHAPGAKICFNTNPTDTAEAVQRWSDANSAWGACGR